MCFFLIMQHNDILCYLNITSPSKRLHHTHKEKQNNSRVDAHARFDVGIPVCSFHWSASQYDGFDCDVVVQVVDCLNLKQHFTL